MSPSATQTAPLKTARPGAKARTRTNDPDRTRANILEVATKEFSEKGLNGARVDEIAELTQTSKRMIYYYFESKEGLYRAVLENCYMRMRAFENDLGLQQKPPLEALAHIVRFTFDYQLANTDFSRLVMVENFHHGEHIAQLSGISELNSVAINTLRDVLARGEAMGVMRAAIDPIDLHMSISALCFFNVANRYTFSNIFKVDMASPPATAARREVVTEMILRYVSV